MRRAGSASWRFAEGIEQMPVAALFVRDAVGLGVPTGAGLPPRLDGDLPDRSSLVNAGQRRAAGAEWVGWWQEVVAHHVGMHQGPPDGTDQRAWLARQAVQTGTLFDPPDFAALAGRSTLRNVVQSTFAEALRWADIQRRTFLMPPDRRPGQFDYETVRSVAEQVAQRHRVSPDAVRGCAIVLPVQGNWWRRFSAGAILCSVHAARDPSSARPALTDAFESGLNT